MRNWNTY